jgi:methyl-accepting chemotaxis protein/CheY-like chemotaxis protein
MKVRTKLFGGFFLVVAIGVLLGILGYFNNRQLTSSTEDLLDLSDTRSRMSSILNSHYIWRHGLSESVYTGAEFTGSLDSNTCSLGSWLNSDAVKNVTDPETVTLLKQIDTPHAFIHAKAGEIVNHLKNDQQDDAIEIFRNEVLPRTQDVISDLQAMADRYGDLLVGDTNVIYNTGIQFERYIKFFIVFALVVSIVLAFIITLNIVRPTVKVTTSLKDISEGEGDLTKHLDIKRNDEFGDLSFYFNQTLGSIGSLVRKIKNKVNALTNTGHELNINMAKTSEVVDKLSVDFEEMKKAKDRQEKSASEADRAVNEIQTSLVSMNKSVEQQSDSINTSSTAIEEMTANIRSVTKTLMENARNVSELSDASDNGKAGVQMVAERIQEIARNSEGLLEINSVMENIASQTNLLSMNAAIEAAHAGEAGKGFAVVAGEIRKLAESSGNQSKTTADMLKKIKMSIDSITASFKEVRSRFDVIDQGVKTVSLHEQNIRNAMEEQEAGGQQILDSMSCLKEINISVVKGSENMQSSADYLIKQTNELIKISTEAINGMNEIVSGAMGQIQTAVKQVDEMSTENTRNFEELKKETEKFKVTSGNEKKQIIVVDDDEIIRGMANTVLGNNYEVITVESGEEALKKFFTGLVPNLVLLDLTMPGMDGWHTYEKIHRISKLHSVPIAIFSSSDDAKDKAHAEKIGAVDYIKKPCKDLLDRVNKILS